MDKVIRRILGFSLLFGAVPAWAGYITVITFGGANMEVQERTFYKPFAEATGTTVVHGSYNGEMKKLKRMVDMGHVTWDLLEVEAPELARGCEEGLFEKIDPALLGDAADFVPGTIQPCGIGMFVWSTVLAYDAARLPGAPSGWSDFWNVEQFPGKRGMRWGAKYNLEFALLADGVAPRDVYRVLGTPAGVDRAFRKLDQLKSDILWWKAGTESVRALQEGKVSMSVAYNGRIALARKEMPSLNMVWAGSIYDFDYWALPKGSWKGEQARQFIGFVSQPEQQKAFAEGISYSPVNNKAIAAIDPAVAASLPTAPANIAHAIPMNVQFWVDNGPALEQRFEAWAGK